MEKTERQLWREKADAEYDELRAEIDLARAKIRNAGADASIEWQEAGRDLDNWVDRARVNLENFGDDVEDKWEEVKHDAQRGWEDFKFEVRKTLDALRD